MLRPNTELRLHQENILTVHLLHRFPGVSIWFPSRGTQNTCVGQWNSAPPLPCRGCWERVKTGLQDISLRPKATRQPELSLKDMHSGAGPWSSGSSYHFHSQLKTRSGSKLNTSVESFLGLLASRLPKACPPLVPAHNGPQAQMPDFNFQVLFSQSFACCAPQHS